MGQPYEKPDVHWQLPEVDPVIRERLKAEIQRWRRVFVPIIVDEYFRHLLTGADPSVIGV